MSLASWQFFHHLGTFAVASIFSTKRAINVLSQTTCLDLLTSTTSFFIKVCFIVSMHNNIKLFYTIR